MFHGPPDDLVDAPLRFAIAAIESRPRVATVSAWLALVSGRVGEQSKLGEVVAHRRSEHEQLAIRMQCSELGDIALGDVEYVAVPAPVDSWKFCIRRVGSLCDPSSIVVDLYAVVLDDALAAELLQSDRSSGHAIAEGYDHYARCGRIVCHGVYHLYHRGGGCDSRVGGAEDLGDGAFIRGSARHCRCRWMADRSRIGASRVVPRLDLWASGPVACPWECVFGDFPDVECLRRELVNTIHAEHEFF